MTISGAGTATEHEQQFPWERQLRPALEAIGTDVPTSRALVVGIAGSGKSRVLRHLHHVLARERRASTLLDADTDLAGIPRSHILLVDDLHLMSASQLARIRGRAEDPRAAIIATSRPWPWSTAASGVARELERSRPAIVLGHLSRSDVLTHLAGTGEHLDTGCLDHILAATGGVSWLVSEALAVHDPRDCVDDAAHSELRRALEERIAHRLDTLDPALRAGLELICLTPERIAGSAELARDRDDLVMRAYAEGLATRAGRPVPIVRACVQATIPTHRLIDLGPGLAADVAESAAAADDMDWIARTGDPRVGEVLVEHADRLVDTHPARAAELYLGARRAGMDAETLRARSARASWASGDLDGAAAIVHEAGVQGLDDESLVDVAAATWAARGMMPLAADAYRAAEPHGPVSRVKALVARLASGDRSVAPSVRDAMTPPSPLGAAMELLERGLLRTVQRGAAGFSSTTVVDLVRASELYTSARTSEPVPELPAVIAAVVALSLGDVDTAGTVLDDAVAGAQGGAPARGRLLLWRAWVAVQAARPADAEALLARVREDGERLAPRDDLLLRTTRLALARRYEDAASLHAAWQHARPAIGRVDVDLFSLLLLVELVCSAAKVGDEEWIAAPFAAALDLTSKLGSPPVWVAHLRWAGIQQGILTNAPDTLVPHAHALVATGAGSPVATSMARAGRVWTSVLAGTVDAEAVEAEARELASIGLRWDAARLAGHGAGRSTDRRVAARLLSTAREIHPNDVAARQTAAAGQTAPAATSAPAEELLSERELDVARLVLQGKTYAEIGESIFISPRTAEHHIAHIRRRLGASSRSEMIAKLRVLIEGPHDVQPAPKGAADASP